jgi:two-component system, chemotaxis family, sensor kinase CheA
VEDQDIINEFLIESNENLTRLEQEIVELEQRPRDPALLASIFRTIHSIKGTCGFLAFTTLERVTHVAENILSQLRNGERNLTPELTSLILETMDAIKRELASIEATSKESGEVYEDLRQRLTLTCNEIQSGAKATPTAAKTEEQAIPEPAASVEVTASSDSLHGVETDEPAPGAHPAGLSAEHEKSASPKSGSIADSTIRVDVSLLDKLMNLVGELVLARNQILQFNSRQDDTGLNGTAQRLNLITTQLQEGVMKTRMQPIGVVWNKLPRVVRDLAASCGKQIQLDMDGAETELDKSIIEAIKDPLTHIVRNCCDHGIELPSKRTQNGKSAQGRLLLRAYHEGGQVNIEITDDGAGIDAIRVKQKAVEKGLLRPEQAERLSEREAVNLVFLPGFSTAEKVTSISGRGVGMDVVKTNIEKIGGVVDLSSRAGEGTTVKIKIPLTLAIIPGLVVNSGGERFIIPQVSLLELLRLEGEAGKKQIERIHGTPVYRRRGSLLPVAYLNEVLHLPAASADSEVLNIVVLQAEDRQFGLVVDAINDTQEIVVKPLGKQLKGLTSYAGATIMGDGKVALILDVLGIGQRSGVLSESRDQARTDGAKNEASHQEHQTFLLFRAGKFERLAVPLSLVARLEEFPAARIEHAAGKAVVQYREQILHLTSLPSELQNGQPSAGTLSDPAQVIVFSDGDHMAGLMVDQILDIHDESIRIGKKSDRPGLSGSAVIGGKVTDFLDLPAILAAADQSWSMQSSAVSRTRTAVLVADSRAFSRGLVRNYLELAGHPVLEAVDRPDALEKLDRNDIAAVVTSRNLASGGGKQLVEQMRKRPGLAHIPVVALCDLKEELGTQDASPFDACVERFDRIGLLDSLKQLSAALEAKEGPQAAELAGARR